MFDRFTDRARKVLGLARQESQRFHHDYIGTEHILLGLILEASGVASDVFVNLDVDPKRLRNEIERRMTHGSTMVPMEQLPFTPRAKRVLELAVEEAQGLGHAYIGTEHLLLGLMREREGIAAQALETLHVRIEDAREEMLEILGTEAGPPPEEEDEPGPLTARVRAAMDLASVLARHSGHEEIGTEHILLGLLDEEEAGSELSTLLGDRLRTETEKLLTPGPAKLAKAPVALAPAARRVMALAFEAAGSRGASRVGAVDLITGLLRAKDGIVARVLAAAGIREEEMLLLIGRVRERAALEPRPPLGLFNRFRIRRPMGYARQEALRLGHDCIGTEHVLLGLLMAPGGVTDLLLGLGADPERLRAEVERRLTPGGASAPTRRQLPFTHALKKALEFTLDEASFGHGGIEEAHLLLGLLREGGAAAQALAACGVTLDAVRKALGPPAPPE